MLTFSVLEACLVLLAAVATSQYNFLTAQIAIGICHSSLLMIWPYLAEVWPEDKRRHIAYITFFQFLAAAFATLTLIGVTMSLVPHYLCLNAGLEFVIFLTTIMFVTSSLKNETVCAQESFPTSLRANGI